MVVEQISVFLENKIGRLAEVTQALTEAKINIRALSLADTSDFGILRLIVNNPDHTRETLKGKGFTVGTTDVVAVEVSDHPGGLNTILQTLGRSNVNVEYMYAYVQPCGENNAILIFRFDKVEEAARILQANNLHVLTGEELYKK